MSKTQSVAERNMLQAEGRLLQCMLDSALKAFAELAKSEDRQAHDPAVLGEQVQIVVDKLSGWGDRAEAYLIHDPTGPKHL